MPNSSTYVPQVARSCSCHMCHCQTIFVIVNDQRRRRGGGAFTAPRDRLYALSRLSPSLYPSHTLCTWCCSVAEAEEKVERVYGLQQLQTMTLSP